MVRHPLLAVLDAVADAPREPGPPVVVFDLDSTLFDTGPRQQRILSEFAATHPERFPALCAAIEAVPAADLGWYAVTTLRERHGELPGLEELALWWRERFFTDHYVAYDVPTPGAARFAAECHERGALVYYLTGRHHGMRAGTERALASHGFPWAAERTHLHVKESLQVRDQAFKQAALSAVAAAGGPVVASFENEPTNANMFVRAFPGGQHFLLRTVCSPWAEAPHPALIPIDDFSY